MLTIRPFNPTEAEYRSIVDVWNTAMLPDLPRPVADFRRFDENPGSHYLYQRLVAVYEGRIVATAHYGEPYWAYEAGKYFIDFIIHPDYQSLGFESPLFERIMAALEKFDPALITAQARENHLVKVQFLLANGFRQVQRDLRSHLDVSRLDPALTAATGAKVESAGIQIVSLAELRNREPAWKPKLWNLDWEILQDVPAPSGAHSRQPLSQFSREVDNPAYRADAVFVALDGNRYVGICVLKPSPDHPHVAHSGMTGVIRSHRRQGIATALKTRAIAFAAEQGIRTIATFNEEQNPMYQLNRKLGFRSLPARLFFERRVATNVVKRASR